MYRAYLNKPAVIIQFDSSGNQPFYAAKEFRFMNPVRQNYGQQLCDAGKQKAGMKCFCILRLAVSETEAVFEMIDGALDGCADFICRIPIISAAYGTGIETQILLWINVNHSAAAGIGTGILTVADTPSFTIFTFVPAHFGTYKFKGLQTTAKMRSVPLRFHGKGWIMRTAWDPVFIKGIVRIDNLGACSERDVSFFESSGLSFGI